MEKPRFDGMGRWSPGLPVIFIFLLGFMSFFEENAAEPDENGLYPTVTARKIMWKLRMKPLKKEYWEEDL